MGELEGGQGRAMGVGVAPAGARPLSYGQGSSGVGGQQPGASSSSGAVPDRCVGLVVGVEGGP